MASPAERVSWIVGASEALKGGSWTDEEMTLNEFRVPRTSVTGQRDDIRSARLQQASDEALEGLWRFVTGASPPAEKATLEHAATADVTRLWAQGSPRIFLSHRAEYKASAKLIKDELGRWKAGVFVAHDDIEPTRVWQLEIERALRTMDVLVALLSTGFGISAWTNQEVGVALGRGVPVISVRLEEDPRGFIGASQAIAGGGRPPAEVARAVIGAMSAHSELVRALLIGLVLQWEAVQNFDEGIRAMGLLDACNAMPADLLERVEDAYEKNDQLHGSVVVGRKYPGFLARMKALEVR